MISLPEAGVAPSARRDWRQAIARQISLVLVVFIFAFTLLSLRIDTFLTTQNLSNLLRNTSWLAIVALGESMVVIIGGIDLSVGATMALASLVAARAAQGGAPLIVAFAIGLAVGALIGGINGVMAARVRLPPFVVTLATMSIARGFAYSFTNGWPITNLPPAFIGLGQSNLTLGAWSIPTPFLIALFVTLLIKLLLTRTVLGSDMYAICSGERALTASGVDVTGLKIIVYVLCGLLAALGGLVFTARLGVAEPTAAIGYEIDVIAATVIGGTSLFGGVGAAFGVLLGAAITQMIYNGFVLLGGPSDWQTTLIGVAILCAVLLDYWRRKRRGASRGTAPESI